MTAVDNSAVLMRLSSAKRNIIAGTIAFFVRCLAARFPHSGQATPPRYGDFEAQRHWMEVTYHKPPSDWYTYDTEYWGLDYPPLSAYFARFLAPFSEFFAGAESVALDSSRGHESPALILFMRVSVIVFEFIVLVPALLSFLGPNASLRSVLLVLLLPALVCVDHNHFQYNCVPLGFVFIAACLMQQKRDYIAAFFYSLSLLFKQTMLYYSFVFFAVMLGRCLKFSKNSLVEIKALRIANLGFVVTMTFLVAILPVTTSTSLMVFLRRIFPIQRGLFEDKVANVWCAINPVLKLRSYFSHSALATISALTCLFASLPLLYFALPTNLGKEKSSKGMIESQKNKIATSESVDIDNVKIARLLAFGSMTFFLFSYQVHEKAILLFILPYVVSHVLQLSDESSSHKSTFATEKNNDLKTSLPWHTIATVNAAAFSLFPLLYREGSALFLITQSCLWTVLACPSLSTAFLHLAPFVLMTLFHHFFPNPVPHLPDLQVFFNVAVSCVIFIISYLEIGYSLTSKRKSKMD